METTVSGTEGLTEMAKPKKPRKPSGRGRSHKPYFFKVKSPRKSKPRKTKR